VLRDFSDEDVEKIAGTFREWRIDDLAWRGETAAEGGTLPADPGASYEDIPGFCKSATTAEIASHGHVLTPGRYVGAEDIEDDGEPFEEKMSRLSAELAVQFSESARLEEAIRNNLKGLGYAL
jgi:type I restriction enzyme M protein